MKTTIYELLGMIKDGKAPKKIIHNNLIFNYGDGGYYNSDYGFLFDNYYVEGILNDEVEILETTITYKPDKIEPLEYEEIKLCNDDVVYDKIISFDNEKLVLKINEIIDRINNE